MKKIISVSRRSDIPAFHGEWFLSALKAGSVIYKNPFNAKETRVSLKVEDVAAFVFWSKNFIPFVDILDEVKKRGYDFYFNYTINNYPSVFEPDLPETNFLIDNAKHLSALYSSDAVVWRYDPIIISEITDYDYHIKNFTMLAKKLSGSVGRCITSFVCRYKKTLRRFGELEKKERLKIINPSLEIKKKLSGALSIIAGSNGIKLYSCCTPEILNENVVGQASCIDAKLIDELFFKDKLSDFRYKPKATRPGCGCYESVDIGSYDSCGYSCVYCYANK